MKLEQIAKGAQISGIEPGKVVRVVSADPLGDNAVTVVYKTDDGRLGERVFFRSNEAPGTVVIHSAERFLYVVQPNNRALRYGIGVGREGFQWSGLVQVSRKAEWPDWRPPPEMLQRQPYLPRFMAGGPGNPMGARALYLGSTVFRVHGTNQPETIGQSISSGCFRLANGDIIDLYSRVPLGTKVVVRHKATI